MSSVSSVKLPLVSKWRWLGSQAAYRRAPLAVLTRLAVWRLHCALGLSARGAWDRLSALGYRFCRFDWQAGRLEPLAAVPGGGNVVALPQ